MCALCFMPKIKDPMAVNIDGQQVRMLTEQKFSDPLESSLKIILVIVWTQVMYLNHMIVKVVPMYYCSNSQKIDPRLPKFHTGQ